MIERVLAGIEHAREIIERGIRDRSRAPICAAPRSDCSGRPAPCRRSARGAARSPAAPPASKTSPGLAARQTSSASVSDGAAVAVGHARPARPRASSSSGSGLPSISSARVSSFSSAASSSGWKHQHARARQQRRVELEGRVLRRGADQRDRAVLHDRQEAILLGAVEAMDLVDEQQRPWPIGAARARRLEHLLEVGDAGEDRRDLLEVRGRSRRRAAAPPSSCRCPAAPRRSSSRASRTDHAASARRRGRADAPGRRPRPSFSAAAGRPAAAARAWSSPARSNRSAISFRPPERAANRPGRRARW